MTIRLRLCSLLMFSSTNTKSTGCQTSRISNQKSIANHFAHAWDLQLVGLALIYKRSHLLPTQPTLW